MSNQEELFDWWATTARKDAEMVVPKSVEYGSNSLEQVGRKMAQLQGREVTKAEALELGCWSYAIGKMERWTDAVMRGETPSIDTLVDLGVYTTMARRIREVGDWPGAVTTRADAEPETAEFKHFDNVRKNGSVLNGIVVHVNRQTAEVYVHWSATGKGDWLKYADLEVVNRPPANTACAQRGWTHRIHERNLELPVAPCADCGFSLSLDIYRKYHVRLFSGHLIVDPDVCYHGDTECGRCGHHAPFDTGECERHLIYRSHLDQDKVECQRFGCTVVFPMRLIRRYGGGDGINADVYDDTLKPANDKAAFMSDLRKATERIDSESRKTTPQGLTLNVGDEVRHVKDRDNPHGVEVIVKELNAEGDGSVRVGWPNRHTDFWVWSNELDLTRRADQICEHKNVNVHTIQPGLPEDPTGVGTCLDCKREVTVKKPFGYTPTMNGAHE